MLLGPPNTPPGGGGIVKVVRKLEQLDLLPQYLSLAIRKKEGGGILLLEEPVPRFFLFCHALQHQDLTNLHIYPRNPFDLNLNGRTCPRFIWRSYFFLLSVAPCSRLCYILFNVH